MELFRARIGKFTARVFGLIRAYEFEQYRAHMLYAYGVGMVTGQCSCRPSRARLEHNTILHKTLPPNRLARAAVLHS